MTGTTYGDSAGTDIKHNFKGNVYTGDLYVRYLYFGDEDGSNNVADYVIAQGTSGSWYWEKYNNGIGKCYLKSWITDSFASLGSVYRGTYAKIGGQTFQFAFKNADSRVITVACEPHSGCMTWWLMTDTMGSATKLPKYTIISPVSAASMAGCAHFYVVGEYST